MDTNNNDNKKIPTTKKSSNIRHFEPRGHGGRRRPRINTGSSGSSSSAQPSAQTQDAVKKQNEASTNNNSQKNTPVQPKDNSEAAVRTANQAKNNEQSNIQETDKLQNGETGRNNHRRRSRHHHSNSEKTNQAQNNFKNENESQKISKSESEKTENTTKTSVKVSKTDISTLDTKNISEAPINIAEEHTTDADKNKVTEEVSAGIAVQPSTESEDTAVRDELIEIIGVRFKQSGKVYYFAPNGLTVEPGMNVIVETARGIEYGNAAVGNKQVELREIVPPLRNVVRLATPEDDAHYAENAEKEKKAFDICLEKIEKHKLEMKLINVEYTFDNNKLLFYFTADSRIDFRELVKDLASVFRTRIELRQIGIRDEAKMIGGLGICGRPFCCKAFLNDFVQVSIKMAKEQNMSLNSAKISGACGRLMCCLRYEYDTYDAELRRTPKIDSIVQTPDGDGIVVEVSPLEEKVKVRMSNNPELPPRTYKRDDVRVKGFAKQEKKDISDEEMKELKALEDK